MKKGILTALLGLFTTILYFVLYVQSYVRDNDGWGTDVSFNSDMLVLTVVGIAILATGLYVCYSIKKQKNTDNAYNIGFATVGALMTLYPFGKMFKYVGKRIDAKGGYAADIKHYLIWGLFGAFIIALAVINYLDTKKKEN